MKHIILLILITLGVLAQEIGVPYVPKDITANITNGAILSDDEENFFSLNESILIQWSLNPIKLEKSYSNIITGRILLFAKDRNEVVIQINNGLVVVSLKEKKIIKQLNTDIQSIIRVGQFIIFADKNNKLHKLNDTNLEQIGELQVSKYQFNQYDKYESYSPITVLFNSSSDEEFHAIIEKKLLFINVKTMKIMKETPYYAKNSFYLSVDRNMLVDPEGGETTIDTKTYQTNFISPHSVQNNSWYIFQTHFQKPLNGYYSYNNKLYAIGSLQKKGVCFFGKKNQQILAIFYQFQKNDWLIMTPDGYFDGSPEAKKYLYMKTSSGESVPIDDATFQKFHKQINLKD